MVISETSVYDFLFHFLIYRNIWDFFLNETVYSFRFAYTMNQYHLFCGFRPLLTLRQFHYEPLLTLTIINSSLVSTFSYVYTKLLWTYIYVFIHHKIMIPSVCLVNKQPFSVLSKQTYRYGTFCHVFFLLYCMLGYRSI